jgi:phage/plasmid-like protein (TIGR03299 family)
VPDYFEAGIFTENKPAWHGAGVVLPDDVVTIDRVFELVPELGSDVVQREVMVSGSGAVIPNVLANVREYDSRVLGLVSERYRVLQNREAFQFGADILDTGAASIKTAGTLHGGSQAWFLLKIDKDVYIGGMEDEKIETYLLISNSHDGKSSVKAAVVTVRVVCANTLAVALKTAPRMYSFAHVAGVDGRIQQARDVLGVAFRYADSLADLGGSLIDQTITEREFDEILTQVFPVKPDASDKSISHSMNKRSSVKNIYKYAPNLTNIKGTKWGALQAVAEWDTHVAPVRGTERNTREQSRFARSVDNGGVTQKALGLLVAA